jgi:hypothetical protein
MTRLITAMLVWLSFAGCKRVEPYNPPAECWLISLDAPEGLRRRCAAHFYARACSAKGVKKDDPGVKLACELLRDRGKTSQDPEVKALARRWAP